MSEAIIVALIGLGGSAVGSLVGVLVSARLTQYRLEQLEKRVEVENQDIKEYIGRTHKLEGQMQEVQHDIRDLKEAVHA